MEIRDVFTEALYNPSLARVYHTSKQIEVAPRFYHLDRRMQDYIMFQLEFMCDTNNNYFDADRKALEKVVTLYPDTKISWFVKEFSNVLLKERNNDFNFKRIRRLFEYISPFPYGLLQKIKNFIK